MLYFNSLILFFQFVIASDCAICLTSINDEYLMDAWGNKFHKYHLDNGTFCNSCSRIISESITNGGFKYNDGRFLCSLCQSTIIEFQKQIDKSYDSVLKQLYNVGFTNIPKNITINLVNLNLLKEFSGDLAHSELKGFTKIDKNSSNNKFAIYILFGLPEIEFNAVLAHELLHVWLHLNNSKISINYKEGFCNLGSYLIYLNDNSKFSKIHLKAMERNPDPIYGYGYIQVKSMLDKLGWEELLNNLHKFN